MRDSTATSRSSACQLAIGSAERAGGSDERRTERELVDVDVLHPAGDRLGIAAQHAEAPLVHDGAVVQDVEQLIGVPLGADLGHQDLDLHRLHLVGEHLTEDLRVLVGQAARVDVVARVLEALQVGGTHTGHAQLIELVVLADAGEGDAVVDLADLAQGVRRVLGHERDAVEVADGHQRTTAGDALACIVGTVLHDLLGCDVERHAHRTRTSAAMAS